jgi:hypothetical protein
MPFVGACGERMPDSAIEPLASWVLQGPLGLLAREITDSKQIRERHMHLVRILAEAAGLAMTFFCSESYFDLHGLERLGLHDILSTTITADYSHHLGEDDTRLDGRPPVILIQPTLVLRCGANLDLANRDELVLYPGLAMIEDREKIAE